MKTLVILVALLLARSAWSAPCATQPALVDASSGSFVICAVVTPTEPVDHYVVDYRVDGIAALVPHPGVVPCGAAGVRCNDGDLIPVTLPAIVRGGGSIIATGQLGAGSLGVQREAPATFPVYGAPKAPVIQKPVP